MRRLASSGYVQYGELSYAFTGQAHLDIRFRVFDSDQNSDNVTISSLDTPRALLLDGGLGFYPVWLGQIYDTALTSSRTDLLEQMITFKAEVTNPDAFDYEKVYQAFASEVIAAPVKEHIQTRFMLHRETGGMLVDSLNVPLNISSSVDLYLLTQATHYVATNNPAAWPLLKAMYCALFISINNDRDVKNNPCQARGGLIVNQFLEL